MCARVTGVSYLAPELPGYILSNSWLQKRLTKILVCKNKQTEKKKATPPPTPSTEGIEKGCATDVLCRLGVRGGVGWGQQADLLGSHEGPFNLPWAVQGGLCGSSQSRVFSKVQSYTVHDL